MVSLSGSIHTPPCGRRSGHSPAQLLRLRLRPHYCAAACSSREPRAHRIPRPLPPPPATPTQPHREAGEAPAPQPSPLPQADWEPCSAEGNHQFAHLQAWPALNVHCDTGGGQVDRSPGQKCAQVPGPAPRAGDLAKASSLGTPRFLPTRASRGAERQERGEQGRGVTGSTPDAAEKGRRSVRRRPAAGALARKSTQVRIACKIRRIFSRQFLYVG